LLELEPEALTIKDILGSTYNLKPIYRMAFYDLTIEDEPGVNTRQVLVAYFGQH